ncbi:unnamed protein product, partial [Mesorhabditis spiculigera]
MQSLWPYQNYKPVTWDKYYEPDGAERQPTVTSGVAAGVTIGLFFVVFLITFGCRIYSQYVDSVSDTTTRRSRSSTTQDSMMSETLATDLWICGVPSDPPPPYDVAIKMPTHNPLRTVEPTPI